MKSVEDKIWGQTESNAWGGVWRQVIEKKGENWLLIRDQVLSPVTEIDAAIKLNIRNGLVGIGSRSWLR